MGRYPMTDGNRGKSNARLRKCLDQIIRSVPPGHVIITEQVARTFMKMDSRLWMTTRRASQLIRERQDVRWVSDGVWQKVRP